MPSWSQRPQPPEPPGGRSRNPLVRLVKASGRAKLLMAVGVLLGVLFVTRSCSGVDISEAQAIATAEQELAAHPLAFTPERIEAQVLRQGFPPSSKWVVVFIVQLPGGGAEDFAHRAAVWIDADSGQPERIEVDEPAAN